MDELLSLVAFIYVVGVFIGIMCVLAGAGDLVGDTSKKGGGWWAIKFTSVQCIGIVAAIFWPISIALIFLGFKLTDTLTKPTA
jgi:hypothetical protein